LVDGDLAEQFQAALDAVSDTDPLLGADPGEGVVDEYLAVRVLRGPMVRRVAG